jgi:rubrerythrin
VVPRSSSTVRRLSDLTAALPADRTLQNLLGLMSSKLELCSRLPIFEYEAANEGHEAIATSFHDMAEDERRSFTELARCLRRYLEETGVGAEPRRTDEEAKG